GIRDRNVTGVQTCALPIFSPELLELIDRTDKTSAKYEGFQANICLNYGGRDEIVHAARAFARDCAAGVRKPDDLTEDLFGGYLRSEERRVGKEGRHARCRQ